MSNKLNKKELNEVNGGTGSEYTAKCKPMLTASLSCGNEFDAAPSDCLGGIKVNINAACLNYLEQHSTQINSIKYFEYDIYENGAFLISGTIEASNLSENGNRKKRAY